MKTSFSSFPFYFAVLFCFTACTSEVGKNDPASDPAVSGHEQMIQMLDSIAESADPKLCYHLNSKIALMIEQQLKEEMPLEQKYGMRFGRAEQLLYAGKTEPAIVEFQQLIQAFGNQLTEQTKPLFEMLALGYLRLGEQENCIERHNAESCILPIQGEGVYQLTIGLENAIQLYEQILNTFPKDLQSRWLLNIAYMNLGKYPEGVPKKWLVPPSLFQSKGDLHFRDVAIPLGLDVLGLSGGVCLEDFDNDGDLDLFMTSYGLTDQSRYFRNNGDGTFSDQTEQSNLLGIVSGLNCLHADYDNDGDSDILILRGAWLTGGTHPNSLLQNDGTGVFTDVTIESGLLSFHPSQSAAWADYDADGDLDLFIANESLPQKTVHPCELFRNNGDGTFTDVAEELGMNLQGFFKGCVWGDVNNDRLPDMYLSNIIGNNLLLINRGGGRFVDIAPQVDVALPRLSFPVWFLDYDNDGWEDIFVISYGNAFQPEAAGDLLNDLMGNLPEGDWFRVYHNEGHSPDGITKFTDVTEQLGLKRLTYGMGCNFGDLDNDGWVDFYIGTGKPDLRSLVPNRMFRNVGGKRFEEISMNGFAHIQKGHGVAFGDIDNDGDQDIYEVMGGAYEGDLANNLLFENPGTPDNKWINIKVEGKKCNRDGLCSRIAVYTEQEDGSKLTIWSNVGTGSSFGSASLQQEIGLGKAKNIEKIEVFWAQPGPKVTVYENVPLNSFVRLVEGDSEVKILGRQSFQLIK